MAKEKVAYKGRLSPGLQVDTEERIAALIFDHPGVETSESDAAELGREILYQVLRVFRPDVFVDAPLPTGGGVSRCPHGFNLDVDHCIECLNQMYERARGN